jgi:hypothetical protein
MRKIAAALIAATMFTTPLFVQGTAFATPAPVVQPDKPAVAKTHAVTVKKHHVQKHKVTKHSVKKHSAKRHLAKKQKHSKHVRHAMHSKSQVVAKSAAK